MRHAWHLFNLAMLLQTVAFFTADTTGNQCLHLAAAVGFGIAARITRPPHPPTLPRRIRKVHRRG
jgi:hypothetical protein